MNANTENHPYQQKREDVNGSFRYILLFFFSGPSITQSLFLHIVATKASGEDVLN